MDATAHLVMISAMNFGPGLNPCSPTGRESVAVLLETTGVFSMPSCGSCAREHPGVSFHKARNWNSVFVRFRRLAKAGFWVGMAKQFSDCPDFEWIMIDASHIKIHQHGMGAPGEQRMQEGPRGHQHQTACSSRFTWYAHSIPADSRKSG